MGFPKDFDSVSDNKAFSSLSPASFDAVIRVLEATIETPIIPPDHRDFLRWYYSLIPGEKEVRVFIVPFLDENEILAYDLIGCVSVNVKHTIEEGGLNATHQINLFVGSETKDLTKYFPTGSFFCRGSGIFMKGEFLISVYTRMSYMNSITKGIW